MRGAVATLALCATGFGPCSKSSGPPAPAASFSANNGGVGMSGESTSFPPITFKKGTGSPVKVETDSTAQVVATLEPMRVLGLRTVARGLCRGGGDGGAAGGGGVGGRELAFDWATIKTPSG